MSELEQKMAQIYAATYASLFKSQSEAMQKRILAVKDDPTLNDKDVDAFAREVCAVAEEVADKSDTKAPDIIK